MHIFATSTLSQLNNTQLCLKAVLDSAHHDSALSKAVLIFFLFLLIEIFLNKLSIAGSLSEHQGPT